MAIENTVLELLAPIVIVASSYALTVIYNVAPFDKNYSKDINNVVFCMIPLALYVVGRLYFGIAFLLTDKFLANYKAAGQYTHNYRLVYLFSFTSYPRNHTALLLF